MSDDRKFLEFAARIDIYSANVKCSKRDCAASTSHGHSCDSCPCDAVSSIARALRIEMCVEHKKAGTFVKKVADDRPQGQPYTLSGGLAHGQSGRLADGPTAYLHIPHFTDGKMLTLEYVRRGLDVVGYLVYEFNRIDGSI